MKSHNPMRQGFYYDGRIASVHGDRLQAPQTQLAFVDRCDTRLAT